MSSEETNVDDESEQWTYTWLEEIGKGPGIGGGDGEAKEGEGGVDQGAWDVGLGHGSL